MLKKIGTSQCVTSAPAQADVQTPNTQNRPEDLHVREGDFRI